jgi:hypothetical protein
MRILRLLLCFSTLLILNQTGLSQFRGIESGWIMVKEPAKWTSPPRKLRSHQKIGPGELIVLYPDGQYGYLACYLILQENGKISISRGDGFLVKTGTWARVGNNVTVTSQTVYMEVVMRGRSIPDRQETELFSTTPQRLLKRVKDNSVFRPLSSFDDLEFLSGVISCDRRYWDGQKDIDGPQPCSSITDSQ